MRKPFLTFLTISVLMAIAPDLYLGLRYMGSWPWWACLADALALAWAAFALWVLYSWCLGQVRSIRFFFTTFIYLIFPKMLFVVLDMAVGWRLALGLTALAVMALAYGKIWGWRRLVVVEASFSSPDLPEAFDGYRILQFSDLHLGTLDRHPEMVERIVEKANSLKPDIMVFTGDIVNHDVEELEPYVEMLSRLKADDGVLAVLGNHDAVDKRHEEQLLRLMSGMGWRVLMDEHVLVGRGDRQIAFVGVGNIGFLPLFSFGDLSKAMADVPEGIFKVLLSHDPNHWRMQVLPDTDIQLTLSGHTHAAQFRIAGFSPARWAYPQWGGAYHEGDRMLFVSQGISGTVPFRLGAWPELDLITLRKSP